MKQLIPRPFISNSDNGVSIVVEGTDHPFVVIERAVETDNGELRVTMRNDVQGFKPAPYMGGTKWRIRSSVLSQVPRFGATTARIEQLDSKRWMIVVPAERAQYESVPRRPRQAKQPSSALATVKEHIKAATIDSPPPNFKPAIPLREAIDTVNAYKAEEGPAMELTVSKRGRLKVKYEYGG